MPAISKYFVISNIEKIKKKQKTLGNNRKFKFFQGFVISNFKIMYIQSSVNFTKFSTWLVKWDKNM